MNTRKRKDGGEGGIRTLDTLPYTHFPGVRLRPLGHLSVRAEFSTASPLPERLTKLEGSANFKTEVMLIRGLRIIQIKVNRLRVGRFHIPAFTERHSHEGREVNLLADQGMRVTVYPDAGGWQRVARCCAKA